MIRNDPVITGKCGKWSWVIVRKMIRNLGSLIAEYHVGQRLCITACDSGGIRPSAEEELLGWKLLGEFMISPPLTLQLEIPCGEYDEWYIFPSLPDSIDITDRYVNYSGFNLVDPHTTAASQGPTWDRTNCDWLVSVQARFWSDMERLGPSSYISSSGADIVVSLNSAFVERVVDIAHQDLA